MKHKMTIWSLSWPLFIEIFLGMFLGIVNTFMISGYSDQAVASVGVANQLVTMLYVIYNVVGFGTSILVSQYLGAGNKEAADRVSEVAFYTNMAFGLVTSLLFVLSSSFILKLMNIPEELVKGSQDYLVIVGLFSVTLSLMATMSATIKSHGYTKVTMYIMIGMNLANIIGVYTALYQPFGIPFLGIRGVASSTAISQTLATLVMFIFLNKSFKFSPSLKSFKPFPKDILMKLFRIGLPSAGEHFSYTFSQLVITAIIASIGTLAITTNVYTLNISNFIRAVGYSVGMGTQIMIGHYVGGKAYTRANNAAYKSLKVALSASLVLAIILNIFKKPIFLQFTSQHEIIAVGSTLLLITLIIDAGRSFNSVFISSLRGAGDVKFPVMIGVISMWGISVPLAYLFGITLGFGLPGIWLAYACDEWVRGIAMVLRWKSKKWQKLSFVE